MSTSCLSLSLSLSLSVDPTEQGNALEWQLPSSSNDGILLLERVPPHSPTPTLHQELPESSEAISWESLLGSLTVTSTGWGAEALSFLISTSIQKIQSSLTSLTDKPHFQHPPRFWQHCPAELSAVPGMFCIRTL